MIQHPFLLHNDLILIDYVPGSSGQLLQRIWSEFDHSLSYENTAILTESKIEDHPSTREVDIDILLPKRLTNWFLERCQPTSLADYAQYFEFLGMTLISLRERWKPGSRNLRFYNDDSYKVIGYKQLYGIHTWDKIIPWQSLVDRGFRIKNVAIVPTTERGLQYQRDRFSLCYPDIAQQRRFQFDSFNNKDAMLKVDWCTMLVDKDTSGIIKWFEEVLDYHFDAGKIPRVTEILETYYREIIDPLWSDHV